MLEIQPPMYITLPDQNKVTIFLGGSIEMGKAEPWQQRLVDTFKENDNVVFFNPRRDDWDSSWTQSIDSVPFNQQVTWELDHLDRAEVVVFYFDPQTMSPITLMELGLMCGKYAESKTILVYCPEGYARKGNVDILCSRHKVPVFESYDAFVDILQRICR